MTTTTMNTLAPVLALALWSFVMGCWMFVVRIRFLRSSGMSPDDTKHLADAAQRMPSSVRQVGDNYNHLFEQPVVFYAVALLIAVAGHGDALHAALAWAYVALRVLHSLIQAISNNVMHRFQVFSLSWIVLAVMIVREGLRIL